MGFEADLVAHLRADSALVTLVGERITPVIRQQSSVRPALVYTLIFGDAQTDLDGDDGDLLQLRVQLDAWATTYADAAQIAERVRLRMQTAASTIKAVPLNTGTADFEPSTKLYRVLMEFSCWYRTS